MSPETVRRPRPTKPICPTCRDYLQVRGEMIARALEQQAADQGRPLIELAGNFMTGLHARHVAGLPIGVPA